MQKPENCTLPTTRHSKTVEFVTHSKERLPHEWCSGANDTRMALTYETQPVWTVFVSGEDKQVRRVCVCVFLHKSDYRTVQCVIQ